MGNLSFKEKFKLGKLTESDIEELLDIEEDLSFQQKSEKFSVILEDNLNSFLKADFNNHLNELSTELEIACKNPLSVGIDELQNMLHLCEDAISSINFNNNEWKEIVAEVANRLDCIDL